MTGPKTFQNVCDERFRDFKAPNPIRGTQLICASECNPQRHHSQRCHGCWVFLGKFWKQVSLPKTCFTVFLWCHGLSRKKKNWKVPAGCRRFFWQEPAFTCEPLQCLGKRCKHPVKNLKIRPGRVLFYKGGAPPND